MVFYLHTCQSKYTNFKDRADFLDLAKTVYRLRDLDLNCGLRVVNLDETNDPHREKTLSDFFLKSDGTYSNIRSYVTKSVIKVKKGARELTDNYGSEIKPLLMNLANKWIPMEKVNTLVKEVKEALQKK